MMEAEVREIFEDDTLLSFRMEEEATSQGMERPMGAE